MKLSRLLRLPYGVSKTGRKWASFTPFQLITDMVFMRIRGASELYITRDNRRYVVLIIENVTDDVLMAVQIESIICTNWITMAEKYARTMKKTYQ